MWWNSQFDRASGGDGDEAGKLACGRFGGWSFSSAIEFELGTIFRLADKVANEEIPWGVVWVRKVVNPGG